MGTDIHLAIEVFSEGQWSEYKGELYVVYDPTWRAYAVFTVLADVRNGGVYQPIDAPRGIPSDCSIPKNGQYWVDGGYHDFTYYTLAELRSATEWHHIEKHFSYLTVNQYRHWKASKNSRPSLELRTEVWGDNTVVLDADTVDEQSVLGLVEDYRTSQLILRCGWEEQPLHHSTFYKWLMEDYAVDSLINDYGANNVRVLISFDS